MNHDEKKIDYSKMFVPEEMTPLFYTPIYDQLSQQQKKRYNQTFGLYCNESFMFFEMTLSKNFLGSLLNNSSCRDIVKDLKTVIKEENEHSIMFFDLNRLCAPDLYNNKKFHFIRIPQLLNLMWQITSSRPHIFPLFIWLMIIIEERAVNFSLPFANPDLDIEPNFKFTYIKHLNDEESHLELDKAVIKKIWNSRGKSIRKFNAGLLTWMMKNFFITPRYGNLMVVKIWISEFDDLKPLFPIIKKLFENLAENENYLNMMYGVNSIPDSRKRMEIWPEFQKLIHILG